MQNHKNYNPVVVLKEKSQDIALKKKPKREVAKGEKNESATNHQSQVVLAEILMV